MAKKKDSDWKDLDKETYMEGDRISEIKITKTPSGNEALKISTYKKISEKYNRPNRGVWLPKGTDFGNWLKWFLITFKKMIHRVWNKEVSVLPEEVDFYKNQVEEYKRRLESAESKLMLSEEELEKQKKDIELAREVTDKIDTYENYFKKIEGLIEESYSKNKRMESVIKNEITSNKWFLGIDCEVKAKEKKVDIQGGIDLHIKTDFQQDKIFEFKSPNLKPFKRKRNESRLYINEPLSEGINQMITYMRKTDIYSTQKSEGFYGIYRPVGIIVIGYKLDNFQEEMIGNWNHHLYPFIRIITYEELIKNAKIQLENIKRAKEQKN